MDHLVLAARDLDAAVDTYRRLGFRVGDRNRHPWGTQNHIVQLEGSFLELIGLAPDFRQLPDTDAAAPFANRIAAFLERHDGLALVALQSSDAVADAGTFAGAGEAPRILRFDRTAAGQDGVRREVAFTLGFVPSGAAGASEFFACQHHRPENFWAPALQQHPNGARRLLGLVMAADRTETDERTLVKLFGEAAVTVTDRGSVARAGRQTIEVLSPGSLAARFPAVAPGPAFVACRIGMEDLDTARSILAGSGIGFEEAPNALVVGPEAAQGLVLSFETEAETGGRAP